MMDLNYKLSFQTSLLVFSICFLFGLLICFTIMWIKNYSSSSSSLFTCCLGKSKNKVASDSVNHHDHGSINNRSIPVSRLGASPIGHHVQEDNKGHNHTTRVSLATVQPKYMFMERNDPIYTNYLHKSNKPFLGYVSSSSQQRSSSYFQ